METHKEMMRSYLCESLRQLMGRSLFEKITIKQICDRAGVIRATFYNYFDDKYDCLSTIVYLDLAEVLDHADGETVQEMLEQIFEVIDANRTFYREAYQVSGQNGFEEILRKNLTEFLGRYLEQNRDPDVLSAYSNEYLARYYAENAAFHIREFVFQNNNTVTAHDMAVTMLDLMKNSLSELIRLK